MGPRGVSGDGGARSRALLSPPALTAAGWIVGALTTGLILGTPYLVFGYRSPEMHLVLDTLDACTALLVAYLVYGRFARSGRLQDLLLAEGLFVLGIAGLGLRLLVGLVTPGPPHTVGVWVPIALRTIGCLFIAASALAPDRLLAHRLRRGARALPWLLVGLALVMLVLLRGHLPPAVAETPPQSAAHPVLSGHPMLLAAQSLGSLCFFVASILFTRQAVRREDELMRWLGAGCALAGFARLNYVLFPSLYSSWIYTGDFLRTTSYLLLLVGAALEIGQYWSAQARAAVLDDRRRLARELHDGVVQELAYIRAEAHALAPGLVTERIVEACDRGLDEARAAVDALGRSSTEPLAFTLHRAARQVAERYCARVDVDLDDSADADTDQRHALVRITREAVSNAIRHGQAERICVRLTRDGDTRLLVVSDDGRGFDPRSVGGTSTGYGLTSMADRARAMGGSFELESQPGGGTTVMVAW